MTYDRVSERRALDRVLAVGIVGAAMFVGYAGLQFMNRSAVSPVAKSAEEPQQGRLPPGTYYFEVPASQLAQFAQLDKPAVAGVVAIYECVVDGQKILSDRDCGPGSVQRDIDTRGLSTYEPGPLPYVDMRRYGTPTQEYVSERAQSSGSASDPSAWKQLRKKEQCAWIQERIDWINARMRAGYTSQEGEYWRARWYEAKNASSEARCGKPD